MAKVVLIRAVDWAMLADQVDKSHEFEIIRGSIVGFVVSESDEFITVCQQWFDSDQVRCSLSIPKLCITEIVRFD